MNLTLPATFRDLLAAAFLPCSFINRANDPLILQRLLSLTTRLRPRGLSQKAKEGARMRVGCIEQNGWRFNSPILLLNQLDIIRHAPFWGGGGDFIAAPCGGFALLGQRERGTTILDFFHYS